EYFLLIEDKTHTKDHSNQLNTYYNKAIERGFTEDKIIAIYFKTQEQSCFESISKASFKQYLRIDILKILHQYQGLNQVLIDFRNHLITIESNHNFLSKPVTKWGRSSFIGFYQLLQQRIPGSKWSYVSNPTGGFMGFFWNFRTTDVGKVYMQLEGKGKDLTLCFKVNIKDRELQSKYRNKYSKLLLSQNSNLIDDNLTKPSRFGKGKYMSIGVLLEDIRVVDGDILDVEQTIYRLVQFQEHYDSIIF
ncbi:MAG: hypothetical protein HAW67_00055, partial [Endozoicomonadaceae bacterium]|nr:hypothetical protein [Endozoicomonadaceae bacterium]